jgi:hypothetical protein
MLHVCSRTCCAPALSGLADVRLAAVCADKDTEEESDVCRQAILSRDKALDYDKVSGKRGGESPRTGMADVSCKRCHMFSIGGASSR